MNYHVHNGKAQYGGKPPFKHKYEFEAWAHKRWPSEPKSLWKKKKKSEMVAIWYSDNNRQKRKGSGTEDMSKKISNEKKNARKAFLREGLKGRPFQPPVHCTNCGKELMQGDSPHHTLGQINLQMVIDKAFENPENYSCKPKENKDG
jgi:hypothetical protein